MIKATIPFLLLALFACSNSDNDPDPGKEPGPAPGEVVTYGNESLVAVDPAGKEIAFDYRAPRDKKVGIFYFIWRDNKLVLLHGFTKKTQKTPPREIQTAKTRLADYEARYGTAYS